MRPRIGPFAGCLLLAASLTLAANGRAVNSRSAEVYEIGWMQPSTAESLRSDAHWTYCAGPDGIECFGNEDGRLRWRRSWPEVSALPATPRTWRWALRPGIVEVEVYPSANTRRSGVIHFRFDSRTGRLLSVPDASRIAFWEPLAVGDYMVKMGPGNELTVRSRRGATALWSRPGGPNEREGKPLYYYHAFVGDRILLMDPTGELELLRLQDGRSLWRVPGSSGANEVNGPYDRLLVADGIVYTSRPPERVVAVDVATGRVRWERHLTGTPLAVRSGRLLLGEIWGTVFGAVRIDDGSIAWSDRSRRYGSMSLIEGRPNAGRQITLRGMAPLRLPGGRIAVGSEVYTETTVDVQDGKRLGRVQPWIRGDWRRWWLVSTGAHVAQVHRKPLPATPSERQAAAALLVEALFGPEAFPIIASSRAPAPKAVREAVNQSVKDDLREPLLRLGEDSAPALLAHLERTVRAPLPESQPDASPTRRLSPALWFLESLGLSETSPDLLRLFQLAGGPSDKEELASALIRLNARNARNALAEYAMQPEAIDPEVRTACLQFVCRSLPLPGDGGARKAALQRRLTSYLREIATVDFSDYAALPKLENTAGEVRQFALFELNARDRETAEHLWRKLPMPYGDFEMVSLSGDGCAPDPDSVRTSADGTEWGVPQVGGLFGDRAFILRRTSGNAKWKAVYAGESGLAPARGMEIFGLPWFEKVEQDRLQVAWKESPQSLGSPQAERRATLPVRDLLRDTDVDGLTDSLERYVGLDPALADTNRNGISDAADPAPRSFRHRLSTDEAVLRAALWGLFRWVRIAGNDPFYSSDHHGPGLRSRVMVIPTPPGSKGIEAPDGPETLLCKPIDQIQWPYLPWFLPPALNDEGHYAPPALRWWNPDYDPLQFFSGKAYAKATFKEYFPYKLSRDGKTARVAFQRLQITIRKSEGEWRPVSCAPIPGLENSRAIAPFGYRDRSDQPPEP